MFIVYVIVVYVFKDYIFEIACYMDFDGGAQSSTSYASLNSL